MQKVPPTTEKQVLISVQDTGSGLDQQKLEALFQPFNSLGQDAGMEQGTGIGLVVTKRLVEVMGGTDDMLDDAIADDASRWAQYIVTLRASGQFDGGSAIGPGMLCKEQGRDQPAPTDIRGYIRVRADNLDQVRQYLIGNPTYEAGGTVEIRELPGT